MRSFFVKLILLVALVLACAFVPGFWDWYSKAVDWAWPYVKPVGVVLFLVLCGPGILALDGFVYAIPGGADYYGRTPWLHPFGVAFIFGFSLLFWQFIVPYTAKLIGLWNPFSKRDSAPWVLRAVVRFRYWRERYKKFGREATGGWATFLEVLSLRYEPGDIFLGRPRFNIGGGLLRPIGIKTEKHMVTIAAPGSGKSTAALIPNLCIHEGSLLCIDPKGELATITASRRAYGGNGMYGMGQDVHVLDPYSTTPFASASYNVFDELDAISKTDPDAIVSYANKIAEALIPHGHGSEEYWNNAARGIISGLVLQVLQGPAELRHLMQVRELLLHGDKVAFEQYVAAGELSAVKHTAWDALLKNMEDAPESPFQQAIRDGASTTLQMSPNQRGGVQTVAAEHTKFLNDPKLRNISARSSFLLADLKQKPTSVYVTLPLNMVNGPAKGWMRLFVLLFIDMMYRSAKKPNPPVLLAIDEFPSLGRLEGIETIGPTMRSYGVRFWVVAQDIEQLEAVYPESWGTIIGTAQAVQFMGITHTRTVAWIVEHLGTHIVEKSAGEGGQKQVWSETRNLLDADQVSKILAPELRNQIIWRGDKRPMMLKLTPYFSYMPYWYYDRDPRYKESFTRWIWRLGRRQSPYPVRRDGLSPEKQINQKERQEIVPPKPNDPNPPQKTPGSDWAKLLQDPNADWSHFRLTPETMDDYRRLMDYALNRKVPDHIKEVLNAKPKPTTSTSHNHDPLADLENMIGMDGVKTQVEQVLSVVKDEQVRRRKGLKPVKMTHHLVFTGNPGTGKTTVARILGQIYREYGVLKTGQFVEAKRADLVAEYLGQTAPKVMSVVERATDGVLFIDEAYSLYGGSGDDYGLEAISTLIAEMENRRDRLIVILAGYKDKMAELISSNPGLSSRFRTFIDFPDYKSEELMEILLKECADQDFQLSSDAMIEAAKRIRDLKRGPNFGNARTIRNLFHECVSRRAVRVLRGDNEPEGSLSIFEASDIPPEGVWHE